MPRYEYSDGHSSKFWEIERKGKQITTHWGRLGADGQTKTKAYSSADEATEDYTKQVKAKQKKGYALATGAAPASASSTPQARDKKLEAQIIETPDEPDAYLVYADWLDGQGDPRGELIELQHGLLNAPKDKKLRNAEAKLLTAHPTHFFGPSHDPEKPSVPERDKNNRRVMRRGFGQEDLQYPDKTIRWRYGYFSKVDWYCGYVQELWFQPGYYNDDEDAGSCAELLERFLTHPSARFLSRLYIGDIWVDESRGIGPNLTEIVDVLTRVPCAKQLDTLCFIGGDHDISGVELDASELYRACPNLRELRLYGGMITLGKIRHAKLERFSLCTGGLPASELQALSDAKWPQLESLSIYFGRSDYGASGGVDDIAQILKGRGLPNLEHLGLCNSEFTDELCAQLPLAKVLEQLQTLDLSLGVMGEVGAKALLAAPQAFAHLRSLDLRDNYIPKEYHGDLKKLCADVNLRNQDDAPPEDRYATVGE